MFSFCRISLATALMCGLLVTGCASRQQHEKECELVLAVSYGHVDEAKRLLRLGVDPNTTDDGVPVLMSAALKGENQIIQLLLAAGANVDKPNTFGQTALMWACAEGHNSTASILLRGGAEINAKDGFGKTPVMKAVEGKHVSTVALLIKAGVNVNVVDKMGQTPLSEAIERHQVEIARLLTSAGARNEKIQAH